MSLEPALLQPRRGFSAFVVSAAVVAVTYALASHLAMPMGFMVVTSGVLFGVAPLIMVLTHDGFDTYAPPPQELPSFLSAVRAALGKRGYTVEQRDGDRYVFREPRVLGNRFVVDATVDFVRIAGASHDVRAVLEAVFAYHRGDGIGPRSAYRGLVSSS